MPTFLSKNELLHSNNCKLPCYLGITPGKTTLSEAKTALENIGAKYHGSNTFDPDHATEYDYDVRVGVPPDIPGTPAPDDAKNIIRFRIEFFSTTDIIQTIDVVTEAEESKDEYRVYWSMYSAKEILRRYGPPAEMTLFTMIQKWLF